MAEIPVQIIVNSRASEIIANLTTYFDKVSLETPAKEEAGEETPIQLPPTKIISLLENAIGREKENEIPSQNDETPTNKIELSKLTLPSIEFPEFKEYIPVSKEILLKNNDTKEPTHIELSKNDIDKISINLKDIEINKIDSLEILKQQAVIVPKISLNEIQNTLSTDIVLKEDSPKETSIELFEQKEFSVSDIALEKEQFNSESITLSEREGVSSVAIPLTKKEDYKSKSIDIIKTQPLVLPIINFKETKMEGDEIELQTLGLPNAKEIEFEKPRFEGSEIELSEEKLPRSKEIQLENLSIAIPEIALKNVEGHEIADVELTKNSFVPSEPIEIENRTLNNIISIPLKKLPTIKYNDIDITHINFDKTEIDLTDIKLPTSKEIGLNKEEFKVNNVELSIPQKFESVDVNLSRLSTFEPQNIELSPEEFQKAYVPELNELNLGISNEISLNQPPIAQRENMVLAQPTDWESTFLEPTVLTLSRNLGIV